MTLCAAPIVFIPIASTYSTSFVQLMCHHSLARLRSALLCLAFCKAGGEPRTARRTSGITDDVQDTYALRVFWVYSVNFWRNSVHFGHLFEASPFRTYSIDIWKNPMHLEHILCTFEGILYILSTFSGSPVFSEHIMSAFQIPHTFWHFQGTWCIFTIFDWLLKAPRQF